jgi:YD repeat-containing protein
VLVVDGKASTRCALIGTSSPAGSRTRLVWDRSQRRSPRFGRDRDGAYRGEGFARRPEAERQGGQRQAAVRFAGISFAPGEYLRVASDVQHSCNKRGRGPRVGAPTHYSPNVVLVLCHSLVDL